MGDPLRKGDAVQGASFGVGATGLRGGRGKTRARVPGGLHEKRGNTGAEKPGQPLTSPLTSPGASALTRPPRRKQKSGMERGSVSKTRLVSHGGGILFVCSGARGEVGAELGGSSASSQPRGVGAGGGVGKQSETGFLRFIYSLEGEKLSGRRGRAEEVLQCRAERGSTSLMVCCPGGAKRCLEARHGGDFSPTGRERQALSTGKS